MPTTRATTLTLESIDSFRKWLSEVRGRPLNTVKSYTSDLRMFLLDLGEPTVSMEELPDLGMSWLTQKRGILAPRTTARRLTSLREFSKWAGYPGMFDDYEAPDGGPGVPHPMQEGMDGVRRMIAATSNEKHRAVIALCGFVGLRLAEALSITPANFTFADKDASLTIRGKGDVTRTVPVSNEAMEHLFFPIGRAMRDGGPIAPISDRFARRTITELGRKARLSRRISSHDLRATFATELYNRTLDQRLVQLLLGHKDGRTTEIYIGVAAKKMREGVESL